MSRLVKPSRATDPARVIRKDGERRKESLWYSGRLTVERVELVLMALGITNRTRKTGLEKAMSVEEVSVIAALAQRAHNTHVDSQFTILALSNGRQPGGDLLETG